MGPNGAPAVRDLLVTLQDPDPLVREAAAFAVGDIGPTNFNERVVPALLEVLENDKDPKVRQAAAQKLEPLGNKAVAAVPALVKALKDPDAAVREAATSALGAIDPSNKALVDSAPARATVNGKYRKLLRKIKVEEDRQSYGNFYDWGHYTGTSWAGHNNLPPGYWVYVYPHWYIWGEMRPK